MGWGQCDVEGGRLPETLLCFALQGDRGVPGPEGEKVGVLGQLWHGGVTPTLPQSSHPGRGWQDAHDTFLSLLSCRVRREPQGAQGHRAER